GSGQSCVIGVLSACCDNRVSPLVLRIPQQKLQFPHLIASESETHNIVSFHEDSSTKPSTHRPSVLSRCRKGGKTNPGSRCDLGIYSEFVTNTHHHRGCTHVFENSLQR